MVVNREKDVPADHDSDEDFDQEVTDDEESDEEEEALALTPPGSPLGGRKRTRRILRKDGGVDSDEEEDEARSLQASPGAPAARKITRAARKRRWKRYYGRGNYRGFPASHAMWQLVTHLHRERNDLLWLAIVGVTYALLHGKLEADLY